ncbi:hypothetical protein KEM52_001868, partial [Ascosphaera acerosa]
MENCTVTVRVPRWHLAAGKREEICYRRALWGTGVYTDDSDPVAAAIHSGFLRGAWNPKIDTRLLDLAIRPEHGHATCSAESAPPTSTGSSKRKAARRGEGGASLTRTNPPEPSSNTTRLGTGPTTKRSSAGETIVLPPLP